MQTILQQDAVGNPPRKRVNKGLARLQKRLKTLCEDRVQGSKSIPEFLEGMWAITSVTISAIEAKLSFHEL